MGILDPIENIMRIILHFYYNLAGYIGMANWGLAIILLTITIKMLLYPLTVKQIKGMRSMQKVQPKMAELQKKHKGDKPRLQQEMAKLYKDEKVNPLSGCLPIVVQMPILIALYWSIYGLAELKDASFLWIPDLAAHSTIPTLILAVLSAATTFWSTKQTQGKQQPAANQSDQAAQTQKMMLYIMPVFIGYMTYSFPAGLGIYWVTSNLVQVAQQWWLYKKLDEKEANTVVLIEEKKKK